MLPGLLALLLVLGAREDELDELVAAVRAEIPSTVPSEIVAHLRELIAARRLVESAT